MAEIASLTERVRPARYVAGGEPARRLLLGLIGYPISHSASPAIHRAAAASVGCAAHYQLIEVPAASPETLRAMLDGVPARLRRREHHLPL